MCTQGRLSKTGDLIVVRRIGICTTGTTSFRTRTPGSHEDVLVTGLLVDTVYEFKVVPYNDVGREARFVTQ